MPDADHDQHHEHDRAVVAEDVDEDLNDRLNDRLPDFDVDTSRFVEILDGEEKRNKEEKAEDCGDAD